MNPLILAALRRLMMNVRIGPEKVLSPLCALLGTVLLAAPVLGDQLFSASLKNGDYGSGQTIDTLDPDHGGSPHNLGIVDGPEGVTFTPTELDGRSNAVIYWQPGADSLSFRQHGTIAMWVNIDRDTFTAAGSGVLWGDNYGWAAFRHGQSCIESGAGHVAGGPGPEDDRARVGLQFLHSGAWQVIPTAERPTLEYGRWHNIGYAWGGPEHDYEIWIDGDLAASYDLTGGASFPWGVSNAATNVGLGDLHERGYDAYGTVSGATFRDLKIWDEYVAQGGTIPEPSTLLLLSAGVLGLLAYALRRRTR